MTSDAQPTVGLYDRGGMISYTNVLLSIAAAVRLRDELGSALANSESIALASWPRKVCSFPVSPHTRGKEEYCSIHLDAGPKPYSKWQIRGQSFIKSIHSIFWLVGVVTFIRWVLGAV